MKTKLNLALLALTTLTCANSQASVKDMVGNWNGTGSAFTLSGESKGTYAIQMTDTLQADGSVASSITIAIPNAPPKQIDLILRQTNRGFSMVSTQASGQSTSGGATCVYKGLCEGYFGDSNGNGVAITFITDGPNQIRLLKTELEANKATGLTLEKYVRVQSK